MDTANQTAENKVLWYFQKDNAQAGPVDSSEVQRMITYGLINRNTMVWREGMTDWLSAIETELGSMFSKIGPPPIAPPPSLTKSNISYPIQVDDVKRLNTWFSIFWIAIAFIPLSLSLMMILPSALVPGGWELLMWPVAYIVSIIFHYLIIYKLWTLIPTDRAKTTPGKAVGFSFIPFFNFYWIFIAYHGLAQAINIELKQNQIAGNNVNETLTLTVCILTCCIIIPYLGILTFIAALIFIIITLKQMKDAGIVLIQHQLG